MGTNKGIWSRLVPAGKAAATEAILSARIDGVAWKTTDVPTAYSRMAGKRIATVSARSIAKPVSILTLGLILPDDAKLPPAFYIASGGNPFKTNHGSFTFDATATGLLEGWYAFKKGVVSIETVSAAGKTVTGRFSATATNVQNTTIQIDGTFNDVPFDPTAG